MKKAIPYIRATNTVLDRKKAEKAELEAELQHIPRIRKKKRSEIETKIYGLSEEITDLTTEHNRLRRIAGSTVEIAEQRIKEEEDNLAVFEKWEDHLYETIEETVAKYEEKKAEAAGCDQAELDNERKKLRPEKYDEAYDTIEKQYGICNMDRLLASQKNAAKLLGEEPDERIIFSKPEPKQPTLIKHRDDIDR